MSDVAATERTRQQRHGALGLANEIRLDRARLRHEIAALPMEEGCAKLAEVLMVMPRSIRSMAVGNILRWPSRVGRPRAEKWLASARCSESRKIGLLSERQRLLLAGLLREHGTEAPIPDPDDLDLAILDCLDMADYEDALTMGRDIAADVGVPGRLLGSRLSSLERRGYIVGLVVAGTDGLKGWRTSEAWRAGVLPR